MAEQQEARFERKLQPKCFRCKHYRGYHFVGENKIVYCSSVKCKHEYRFPPPEKNREFVERGKRAYGTRKMLDEAENAIFLCKGFALAEKLGELGQSGLKESLEKEFTVGVAWFIANKRKRQVNYSKMAEHWETYLLTIHTDCGTWDRSFEVAMPKYPRRLWLWLWLNFAETRARRIFDEVFIKKEVVTAANNLV